MSSLVPAPVAISVLTPPSPEPLPQDLPLVLLLHGGDANPEFLAMLRPLVERAWSEGALPPSIVATPLVGRSFYMDYQDGSQRWESFVTGPLLDDLRSRYGTATEPSRTGLIGISMSGMGALRMGFKRPRDFAVVAALEPGIEPVLDYSKIELRDRFWRSDELECGDADSLGLHRGAEFLHRLLWDREIRHEYRRVRGADHLGRSLERRFLDAFRFVGSALCPPPPDETLAPFHTLMAKLKQAAGLSRGLSDTPSPAALVQGPDRGREGRNRPEVKQRVDNE